MDEVVRLWERDREARQSLEAKWTYEVLVEVASERLHLDVEGKRAFVLHPDHNLVRHVVNELVALGWTGVGRPPKV